MRLTRVIGPALGVSLVLLAGACGDESGDSPDTGSDPSAETSETPTETPTQAPAVDPIDFGDEPAVKTGYKKAALRAVDDELAVGGSLLGTEEFLDFMPSWDGRLGTHLRD